MNAPDFSKTLKLLPNRDDHNCFGCSPSNQSGLQMKFYTDDTRVYSRLSVPEHLCGWNTLVHGGVISTILDEIMSWGAIYLLRQIVLTKSISVDFLQPIMINEDIRVEGKVLERTGEREAVMQGFIYNDKGVLAARSTGIFALFSPDVLREKGIMSDKDIQYFEMMMLNN
ncbi:MAG: hypothetical protein CVV44_23155 [Spirochaetae bacterium HGW-Spirochaetae-1]|jgi:uncharacterized protein (TIGR00369 family)|nr:MAG: hypothetical protein CVV44_23155 [Spirochaetae bacterium HGW-Spirochaetae-1]